MLADFYFFAIIILISRKTRFKNGNYTIGLLNEYGQRISIRVELPRKKGDGTVSFITGWMVNPNGLIQLNTPFGGK